jgi:DNA-directed RNA polymerase specialized sigma24 family protein
VSQPLIDQRPRAELIAALYDRHAAGLFAYCADQLGDLGSASDVLLSVLSGVPETEPPRAALYAFARREIHRRDVVYAPPAVDPLADPATALVERTLRELRPHQREVLVLCAVCGLSKAELAWVLDVAPDTAEELAVGAANRFRQGLGTALSSTGVRAPKPIADVYGALAVAPLRDVLGRLPWPQPPAALRIHFAGSRSATPAPLFVKPRWPSPPMWPQPLAEDPDPASNTMIFPKELLSPPSPARVSHYEATTTPMRMLGGDPRGGAYSLKEPLGLVHSLRDPLGALDASRSDMSPHNGERPFFMTDPDDDGLQPFATGDVILPSDSPEPFATGDVILPSDLPGRPFSAGDLLAPQPDDGRSPGGLRRPRGTRRTHPSQADDVLVHKGPARPLQPVEEEPAPDTAPLFQPRAKSAEPIYRMPPSWGDEEPPAARTAEAPPVWKDEAKPAAWEPEAPPAWRDETKPAAWAPEEPAAWAPEEPPAAEKDKRKRAPWEVEGKPAPWAGWEAAEASSAARTDRARPTAGEPEERPAVRKLREESSFWAADDESPAGEDSFLAPRPVRARPIPNRRPDLRLVRPDNSHARNRRRQYDWVWEMAGFLVCLAIAMIVFFSLS